MKATNLSAIYICSSYFCFFLFSLERQMDFDFHADMRTYECGVHLGKQKSDTRAWEIDAWVVKFVVFNLQF